MFLAQLLDTGVISGVPLSVSMEEMKTELNGGKVLDAKRIINKRNGERAETSVIIVFDHDIPRKVMLCFFSYTVREFIPPALRCFKCQRMRHTAKQCKGKERCARCLGDHAFGKCGKDVPVKCCNCGGDHSAAFGGCEIQKQEREVQRYKILNKVSYAQAVKSVNNGQVAKKNRTERSNTVNSISPPIVKNREMLQTGHEISHKCKVKEGTMLVDKVNFVGIHMQSG